MKDRSVKRFCTKEMRPPHAPGFRGAAPSPDVARRASVAGVASPLLFLLVCSMLMAAGCGGGGNGGPPVGGPPGVPDPDPPGDRPPAAPNPVGLTFRPTDLGTPNASDGRNYRTPEYMGHWGLDSISADIAYQRGYFGQDVTIAVADHGLDPTHPDLAGRIRAPRHVRNRDANVYEPDEERGAGHGTFVALVAAGARGNSGGSFQIDIAGGSPIPTNNVHGVAPSASVMPIQLSGGGRPYGLLQGHVGNGLRER